MTSLSWVNVQLSKIRATATTLVKYKENEVSYIFILEEYKAIFSTASLTEHWTLYKSSKAVSKVVSVF